MNIHRSFICNSQNLEAAKHPLTSEWLNQQKHIYTVEYYTAIKRNGWLIQVAIWMDLKDITLCEKKKVNLKRLNTI